MTNDVFISNPFYKDIDITEINIKGSPDLKALKEKAFKFLRSRKTWILLLRH